MPRLTAETWEKARAEYEVRGLSLGEVAKNFGVTTPAVLKQARSGGWVQGKSKELVAKKVRAIKDLIEVNTESKQMPLTSQFTFEEIVREQLRAEGLKASFDSAFYKKAINLLENIDNPAELETISRARRNLSPPQQKEQRTTVNVTQQQAQGIIISPRDALAELVKQATGGGDSDASDA